MGFGTDQEKASVFLLSGINSLLICGYRVIYYHVHINFKCFLTFIPPVISYYSGHNTQPKYRTIYQINRKKRVHIATVQMLNLPETTHSKLLAELLIIGYRTVVLFHELCHKSTSCLGSFDHTYQTWLNTTVVRFCTIGKVLRYKGLPKIASCQQKSSSTSSSQPVSCWARFV